MICILHRYTICVGIRVHTVKYEMSEHANVSSHATAHRTLGKKLCGYTTDMESYIKHIHVFPSGNSPKGTCFVNMRIFPQGHSSRILFSHAYNDRRAVVVSYPRYIDVPFMLKGIFWIIGTVFIVYH